VETPFQLAEGYFSIEALNDTAFHQLLSESIQELRLEILHSFIESGKDEGAINASISTESITAFLDAVSDIHVRWEIQRNGNSKVDELCKLMLYGLIGRNIM